MDRINQINSTQGIQPLTPMNSKQIRNREEQGNQHRPPFNLEITQLGQLFSTVEESGESAKNELKQFHESLFGALQNGNFDAGNLVENASDTIKTIAAQAGIDLELAVTEFFGQAEQMNSRTYQAPPPGGRPHHGPPPPPDDLFRSVSNSDEKDNSGVEISG